MKRNEMTKEFLFYSKIRYEEKQNQNNIDTQGIYNSSFFWFGGEIKDRDVTRWMFTDTMLEIL